jgi:predicted nucleotidyltransferase
MTLIRQTSFNQERKNLALEVAQTCTNILIKKFGAKKVILFGSLAGQTPWHDRSDIDLAVEGLPEGTFFRAYSVCRDLLPLDRSFPTGECSHLDWLEQMAENIPQVRTALINPQQYLIFKDYLNFCHFFRHAYGYKLRWQEIRLKLVMMPENFEQLS